jgi:Ca-activated chloride channel family protein
MTRLTYPALLLALNTVVPATSAQQQVESPVLSISTELVTLSVTVVDTRGAVVTGLRQEHFTVFDNGERQTIQFFTSEDLPATVGLIVDSSGSMRGHHEDRAAMGTAFARMGHALDEFFLLQFNETVWPVLPSRGAGTGDLSQLRAALVAAPAQGMTALYDALDRGLQHLEQGTRDRKALIVVSDGGDNASAQTLDAVLDRARRTTAVIYCLTLFDPDSRDARPQVLKALARQTGGRVVTAKRPEDVTRAFAQISQEIRTGYTIGFAPSETSGGGFRSVRVVVDADEHPQLVARTRAGYYAGPSKGTAR